MTRQHKSRYYPSEHLRSLQAQIDEVWEHIERLNEIVRVLAQGEEPEEPDPHDATTAEVANTLKPDAFQVKHLNYGWYQVVDANDQPIHEGKLRKGPAVDVWKTAMEGAWGKCRPYEGV